VTDYTVIIAQIESATSLAEISQAVSSYSASAVGSGGILYSGYVGNSSAHLYRVGCRRSQRSQRGYCQHHR
jgi:hypothetical protein